MIHYTDPTILEAYDFVPNINCIMYRYLIHTYKLHLNMRLQSILGSEGGLKPSSTMKYDGIGLKASARGEAGNTLGYEEHG